MRVALVNPRWTFEGSIYFGCRDPHLPLELGYSRALLEQAGHEVLLLDGHLLDMPHAELADAVAQFRPDMTVLTTAPTYLFWRCAQPELTVPNAFLVALGRGGGATIAVGPHGSSTPGAVLRKLPVDAVIRGECEEAVLELANNGPCHPAAGIVQRSASDGVSPPRATRFVDAPALRWEDTFVTRHTHHHHRFDVSPVGPGAEIEASRGCPYACTFCAKLDFRDRYRRRALPVVLEEIDRLIAQGVTYLYFVDEIFLPNEELLEALAVRAVSFGIQTRIDLWKPDLIELLGRAGCVSIEAGVESLTETGRDELNKKCRLSTEQLAELLIHARRVVPFVQANLIATEHDDAALLARWRERLKAQGVWANEPVPLYSYPSSPDYRRQFGEPDDTAWERAHEHYLRQFATFSDIQEQRPLPLTELEASCHA